MNVLQINSDCIRSEKIIVIWMRGVSPLIILHGSIISEINICKFLSECHLSNIVVSEYISDYDFVVQLLRRISRMFSIIIVIDLKCVKVCRAELIIWAQHLKLDFTYIRVESKVLSNPLSFLDLLLLFLKNGWHASFLD